MFFGRKTWLKVECLVGAWVTAGFFIYLASIFFIDSSRQKTVFYLLVALPALLLFPRFKSLLQSHRWPILSLMAFLSYLIVSALWSGTGMESLQDAAKYSLYLLCLLLSVQAVSGKVDAEIIVRFIIVLGGCACCLYFFMALQHNLDFSRLLAKRSSLGELSGWGENNPISSAVCLGLPVIAAWWYYPSRKWLARGGLLLLMLACLVLMFLTKSRGPIAALGITLLLLVLCRRRREDLLLVLFAISAGVTLFLSLDLISIVMARAEAPNYRNEIWSGALRLIAHNWAFGQGFGHAADIPYARTTATHAHSSVLEVFRVGGVVGGALFMLMLLLLVGKTFYRREEGFFFLWLVYGLLCLSSNGRLPLSRPAIEWFSFWIPLFFIFFYRCRPAFAGRGVSAYSEELPPTNRDAS